MARYQTPRETRIGATDESARFDLAMAIVQEQHSLNPEVLKAARDLSERLRRRQSFSAAPTNLLLATLETLDNEESTGV